MQLGTTATLKIRLCTKEPRSSSSEGERRAEINITYQEEKVAFKIKWI